MNLTRRQIDQLWDMATPDSSLRDPREYRKDFAGAWIRRDRYGFNTPFGWTAGRIKPKARGGTDDMDNLMPCHWRNKRMKGANYPEFKSIVSSIGMANVMRIKTWKAG